MNRKASEGSAITTKNTKGTKGNNACVLVGNVIAIDFLCVLCDLCGFLAALVRASASSLRLPRFLNSFNFRRAK